MRYPASEKAEIIQLVEQSHLPAKRTLDKLGVGGKIRRWHISFKPWNPKVTRSPQLLLIESRHLPLPSSGRAKDNRVLKSSAMAVSARQRNLPGRSSTIRSAHRGGLPTGCGGRVAPAQFWRIVGNDIE